MAGAGPADHGPIDPDASTYDVMAIYGALMLEVQTFEMSAAVLSLVTEVDPERRSNASLRRQLDTAYKRFRHPFRRGSLSASRDRLKGKIDIGLFAEIDELLAHRNRLAHRFLIERMVAPDRFKKGTALEIIEYARRFGGTTKKIKEETERQTRDLPGAPEGVDAIIDRFARSIVLGGDVAASELADPGPRSSATPDVGRSA